MPAPIKIVRPIVFDKSHKPAKPAPCKTCAKIRAASVAIASRIRDVIRGK